MKKHFDALAKASLESSHLNLGEWYESYGLALHLFKSDSKIYTKAMKKRDGHKKHIAKYIEPKLLTTEGVTEEFKKIMRWKTFVERWDAYYEPIAKPQDRVHHLSAVLEALSDEDVPRALIEIDNLPVDYLINDTFWGEVILFIVAARSGDQEQARSITQGLYNMAQSDHNTALLSHLLPALCKKYLDEEYYPWQMKARVVNWNGETYHCVPVLIHNFDAFGGQEYINHTPVRQRARVERKHSVDYVYSTDRYGNRGQSIASATANVGIAVASATGKVIGHTLLLGAAGAIYLALAGKIRVNHYNNSNHKIVLNRKTEMPVNSCGYIVTKQNSTIEPWQDEEGSESIDNSFSFLNFTDGLAYPCRKGYDIPDEQGLIQLLFDEIK
ncbi:hypothetical protein [Vibrio sp. 10N.261.52.F3]|uniref:hypothetical protein n=1 Tax=Vibrio sp. 10N.261.52.F3 TaxID=3229683 RepID=UPI003551F2A5